MPSLNFSTDRELVQTPELNSSTTGIGPLAGRLLWEQDQACSIRASRTIGPVVQIVEHAPDKSAGACASRAWTSIFRQQNQTSDVAVISILRNGVVRNVPAFEAGVVGAGPTSSSISYRQRHHNERADQAISLVLGVLASRLPLTQEKKERYLQDQNCECRLKARTPGCELGNAVSRSVTHPICAFSKDSNAPACKADMRQCKSDNVLHTPLLLNWQKRSAQDGSRSQFESEKRHHYRGHCCG